MIAESVYPVLSHQLRENGGPYVVTRDCEAVVAIPSYSVAGEKVQQGLARPVYIVRDHELYQNGGPFRVIQNQGSRVVKFIPGAVAAGGQAQFGVAQVDQAQAIYVKSGTPDYYLKLLNLFGRSIIGYYPGSEPSLATAYDYSGNRYNGNYVGVTLGQPGIGDGLTCPLYDGVADYMQPPAGFRSAFNPLEFSIFFWFWPFNIGVWTDGIQRIMSRQTVDANNGVFISKPVANNTLSWQYTAGGTTKTVTLGSQSFLIPKHIGLTVSKSMDQMIAYFSGVRTGSIQTGLGTWVGALNATFTVFGAGSATPTFLMNGYAANFIVLNHAATPGEMAQAAVI